MKIYKHFLLFSAMAGFFTSCSESDDIDAPPVEKVEQTTSLEQEIMDFEYKAMNVWYYYNDNLDIYEDDYFANQQELNDWLGNYDSPEDLFYSGLTYRHTRVSTNPVDRFSWIVDDYEELENSFAGTSTSTGMDYGWTRNCSGCSEVSLYVRYIIPGTPAEEAGIERGMVFTEVDGQQITDSNYRDILNKDSFTLTRGRIENGDIVSTDETIDVYKTTVNENPVLIAKTFDVDGTKVGYLMYNSFTFDYSGDLNDAFGQFKADNVTELILDLRYNGGGRVDTAIDLASMITGQFDEDPFVKFQYNEYLQNLYESRGSNLTYKMDNIVQWKDNSAPTNSLNLNRLYVIATGSSASASELVMNGLEPFIDVVHIGTTTVGKVQGSDTYYDSDAPNFNKDSSINPDHKYAIQPLILSLVNKNNEAHPEGLSPDVTQREYIDTYGVLGDPTEPLLSKALDQINPNRSMSKFAKEGKLPVDMIGERKSNQLDYQRMYLGEEMDLDI